MKVINKKQVQCATKLHKKSLAQAEKAAIKMGWDADLVAEISNLEHSLSSLKTVARVNRANEKEALALVEVHQAAKLEMAGFFALSQAK